MKIQKQSDIKAYRGEGFIGDYQKLIKDTVIPDKALEETADKVIDLIEAAQQSVPRKNTVVALRFLTTRGETVVRIK